MKNIFERIGSFFSGALEKRRASVCICLLAGVVGVLPYYCEYLFICTFISIFVIALTIIKSDQKMRCFFWYYIGYFTPLYAFLAELYPYERFGFSETQAVFVVICSCICIPLLHAGVLTAVMLVSKLFPKNAYSAFGYASLWVIGEWVLSLGMMAFPWGGVAVSMTGFLPFLQTISLFGKYFITFIVVSACFLFAHGISERKRIFPVIGVALIILNTVVGTALMLLPSDKGESIKVATVQGNVLANEKWVGDRGEILERYKYLTESAAKEDAEIIVLPESAVPIVFRENGRVHKSFSEIARRYNTTIVMGIRYSDESGEYNSSLAILPDGSITERYDKRHLVPFGEFIPFADIIGKLFPFVGSFNESSSVFVEGENAVVLDTPSGKIAPLVCFDSIFSGFADEATRNGAEMLAVVTNDSWFNDSVGIYTHLRHAQIRAIENGRYVLRSANTGVSSIIDEKGKILEESEPLEVATVYSYVSPIQSRTIYSYIGDVFLYVSFVVLCYFAVLKIIRRKAL